VAKKKINKMKKGFIY